ncbi:MAG: hypothetical protein AAF517_05125, partial [Planctomycetota bacterium]
MPARRRRRRRGVPATVHGPIATAATRETAEIETIATETGEIEIVTEAIETFGIVEIEILEVGRPAVERSVPVRVIGLEVEALRVLRAVDA